MTSPRFTKWELAVLFFSLLGFYVFCPIKTPYDSQLFLPTAVSLLREGNLDLDEYGPNFGHVTHGLRRAGGHVYNDYPVGPALVALPFIAVADLTFRMSGPLLRLHPATARLVDRWRHHFDTVSDLNLDFWNTPQLVIASIIVAFTAVIMYLILLHFLPRRRVLLLTLMFALATSALSTASRALWQHGPSMLFLALTLFALVRASPGGRTPLALAGSFVAAAYVMRPSNAVSVVLFSLYVAATHRREAIWFAVGTLVVAAPWVKLNLHIYQSLLPPYYLSPLRSGESHFGEALIGNLLSPSRGLFIFTPVMLLALPGLWMQLRSGPLRLLWGTVGLAVFLHWIAISLLPIWWAGHSYGPRYFTDMLPYLTLLLIPVVAKLHWTTPASRAAVCGFMVLAGLSLVIHVRGALSTAVYQWNSQPIDVDQVPARVWDWKDPQLLR